MRSPQLAGYAVLQVPSTVDLTTIKQTPKGEVALSVVGQNGALQYATGIQTAGVLDDLYYYPGKLGVVFHANSRPVRIKLRTDQARGMGRLGFPPLRSFSDMSLYQLHIRDFSVNDLTVPSAHRGTYEVFADQNLDGMRHLVALAKTGLKAVHIVPSFHFARVNEDQSTWNTTGESFAVSARHAQQQAAVAAIQGSVLQGVEHLRGGDKQAVDLCPKLCPVAVFVSFVSTVGDHRQCRTNTSEH